MSVTIRQMNEADWQILREIRLKALQTDPASFGSNHEIEVVKSSDEWKSWASGTDGAIFVLLDEKTPIGMTGIALKKADPTGRTAILWGSWIDPAYRNCGLSKILYRARIEWAEAHPAVESIFVSHRASNLASKHANQKHGFVYTHSESKTWHDGVTEDDVCYTMAMKPRRPVSQT